MDYCARSAGLLLDAAVLPVPFTVGAGALVFAAIGVIALVILTVFLVYRSAKGKNRDERNRKL